MINQTTSTKFIVFVNHVIRPKQNIWHKIRVSLEKQSEKLAKSYWKPAWNVLKKIQQRKKNMNNRPMLCLRHDNNKEETLIKKIKNGFKLALVEHVTGDSDLSRMDVKWLLQRIIKIYYRSMRYQCLYFLRENTDS